LDELCRARATARARAIWAGRTLWNAVGSAALRARP